MVWLLVQDYSTHVGVLTQLVIYNYFNNLCALAPLREKFLLLPASKYSKVQSPA